MDPSYDARLEGAEAPAPLLGPVELQPETRAKLAKTERMDLVI